MQRQLQEVVVCAAGPSTSGQGSGTVALYDVATGSALFTLKQTFAGKNSSVATETRDGQGGLVLAAQLDKGLLNVYSYQKDQLHLRIVLPEKLSCIAVDATADYCAGGTVNGRVYLWEIASGIMFNSWEAHYRRISVMKFTHDGAALVTGSDDATASVWAMASLLDNSTSMEIPSAYYTLTDHTLPITDIVCGVGAFPRCRLLTSSLDNSCKITDLASRTLLSTFQFPHPITSLAMDPTERVFFAASSLPSGDIHQVNLFRPRPGISSRAPEAVGGGGHGSAELISLALEEDAEKKRLITVGHSVGCMTISLTGSSLLVGTSSPSASTSSTPSSSTTSQASKLLIYDIPSHQLIRSIAMPKDFGITSLQVMLKPQDLMGHATLSMGTGGAKSEKDNTVPIRSITAFSRTRDPKTREAHEVLILPPASVQQTPHTKRAVGYTPADFLDDYRFFTNPSLSSSATAASSNQAAPAGPAATARITALEGELASVKAQLARAKALNTSIYESALSAILEKEKKNAEAGSGVVASSASGAVTPRKDVLMTDGRPQKRGRAE